LSLNGSGSLPESSQPRSGKWKKSNSSKKAKAKLKLSSKRLKSHLIEICLFLYRISILKGTPAMPSNISRHTCEGPSDIQGSCILLAHPQHVTTVASSHPPRASGPRTAACYCVLAQESVSDASASPPVCVPHRAGSTRSEKLRRLAPPSSRVNTRLTGASL
jgi:hypothetical protein